ncbi:MAG: TolC family protein [Nitrospirae bacterium]|nr:TolC family protein [Nitrospirota bacterium]
MPGLKKILIIYAFIFICGAFSSGGIYADGDGAAPDVLPVTNAYQVPNTYQVADAYPNASPGGSAETGGSQSAEIGKGEKLTLSRCLGIAMKNQPSLTAADYTARAAQSRIGQALSSYYPQVGASANYNRIAPNSLTGAGSASSFNEYAASATLNQNIYDFGRTPTSVEISRLNFGAFGADYENAATQVVFNVKQTYYTLVQTMRNLEVATEAVKQYGQHLDQAKGFYSVGLKAKIDVTTAQVDYSNAKLNLTKAKDALRLARVNLNKAMGVIHPQDYTVEDDLNIIKYDVKLEDVLKEAIERRPDLKAAIVRTRSAEMAVELKKKDYYPTVTGSASYNWLGESFPLSHGWDIGAQVTISVFSGFLTKKQIEEAQSNFNTARANEEIIRQTVVADVEQAFLSLTDAKERIPEAELVVGQAKENLDIANGRYSAGVGSPLEVTDAEVSYENAKLAHIQSLTDYKISEASLEKAIGGK